MLKELSHFDNLGTPRYFWELSNLLKDENKKWTTVNIRDYFFNRMIDGESIFDGCLPFAAAVGLINIDGAGFITIDKSFISFLVNEKYFYHKFLERIFVVLKDDDEFYGIFCSQNISYDIIYRSVQISNSAFTFRYANFKHFLLSFGFINLHPDTNIRKFIINPKFQRLFDKALLPEIKRRKLGIDELSSILEQRRICGEEAEKYVLDFEKNRLSAHSNCQEIKRVSEYDVSAGYDIVSYNDEQSREFDRFIEVKSFFGVIGFHWSRNEIDVARIKKDMYCLYLIDRSRLDDKDYIPLMIKNPYENILNSSKWDKRIEDFFISQSL
jgi:hypothetical protein